MKKFDAVITGARVVDYATKTDAVLDIGIKDGKIAEVSASGLTGSAAVIYPMHGYVAMPGIIDPHVHLRPVDGVYCGFGMAAAAGVCTVMEMSGPCADVLDAVREHGAGLNVAMLEGAIPGSTIANNDPTAAELDRFTDEALKRGCIGIKLLGGHYPMTPEASRRLLEAAAKAGAYAAWHAGSTASPGNFKGMLEVFEIAKGLFVHLAHVNTYCRGQILGEMEEVARAVQLLSENTNVYSESYLAAMNGVSLHVAEDGRMGSRSLANTLGLLGFADSAKGMEEALLAGIFHVITLAEDGREAVRVTGREGARIWRERGTNITGSADANPGFSRAALCLAKRANGTFAVDAIATDGGRYPRNVIVSHGLAMVRFQGLGMAEFVQKTSYNPSRMLRLPNKGHLAPGADADITVLDLERCAPVMTLVGGATCLYKGALFGQGGRIITTKAGEAAVSAKGLPSVLIDPASPLEDFRN